MIHGIPIYVINYKDEARKKKMMDRFGHFGVVPKFVPGVEVTDGRLSKAINRDRRTWSIMLQHLDSIRDFYENTSSNHCIVCEDDIYISRTFDTDVEAAIKGFERLKLDVIMLGYLLPFKLDLSTHLHKQHFENIYTDGKFTYHKYPDDTWGTQMYLISRSYAKYLLKTFTVEYALANPPTFGYSSDWVMTKNGVRVLINPMIAVEEGINKSSDIGQLNFHLACAAVNYDKDKYI